MGDREYCKACNQIIIKQLSRNNLLTYRSRSLLIWTAKQLCPTKTISKRHKFKCGTRFFQHFKHYLCNNFVLFNVRVKYSKNKWKPRRSGVLDLDYWGHGLLKTLVKVRWCKSKLYKYPDSSNPGQRWGSRRTIDMFGEQRTPVQLFGVGVDLSCFRECCSQWQQFTGREKQKHLEGNIRPSLKKAEKRMASANR